MGCDVIGLVAFDLVLRVFRRSMVGISFKVKICSMDFNDHSFNVTSFRIPGHMIAYFKCCFYIVRFR